MADILGQESLTGKESPSVKCPEGVFGVPAEYSKQIHIKSEAVRGTLK
jgi:hypothetical protein